MSMAFDLEICSVLRLNHFYHTQRIVESKSQEASLPLCQLLHALLERLTKEAYTVGKDVTGMKILLSSFPQILF